MIATRRRTAGALIALSWAIYLVALVSKGRFAVITNADSALFPMMGIDLASWGGHWSEWKVGHIAYTFPDYLLYRLARVIFEPPFTALVAAGMGLSLMGAVGALAFARRVVKDPDARLWVSCAIPVFVTGLLCVPEANHFSWIEVSLVHHGGIIAFAPWSLLVAREAAIATTRRPRLLWGGGWILSSAIMFGSDRLALLQLLAPTAVVIAAVRLRSGKKLRALEPFGALVVASGIGVVLEKLLLPQPATGALRAPGTTVLDVLAGAGALFRTEWSMAAAGITLMATLMIACAALGFRAIASGAESERSRTDLALAGSVPLLALGMVIGAVAVGGPVLTAQSQRHIAFSFVLPFLLFPVVVALLPSIPWPRIGRVASSATAAAGFVTVLHWGAGAGIDAGHVEARGGGNIQPAEADIWACLDRETSARGLTFGASGYWDAKLFSLLSNGRLKILQVDPRGLFPSAWVSNVEWPHRFEPDFVIVDPETPTDRRPSREEAIQHYGMPTRSFRCATVDVLVYEGEARAQLHRIWRVMAGDKVLQAPGDSVHFAAAQLPYAQGKVVGEARVTDIAGVLTFGPFLRVDPARYEATIEYESAGPGDPDTWDAALATVPGAPTLLTSGVLPAGASTVDVEVDVTSSGWLEVRTFCAPGHTLTVRAITIRRPK